MTWRARTRPYLAARIAVSLAAISVTASPGRAAELPQCRVLDLSPTFATDGTAFCADSGTTRYAVYRTTDRGRSWTRVGADSSLWVPDKSTVTQIMVSADYANDRTVYLATNSIVYVSTDAGETFAPADMLSGDGSGRRLFAAYVDGTSNLSYLAYAKYESPARLRPPARQPVDGAAPAKTDRFLLPTRVTAATDPLLLAFDGRGESLRSTVYGCSVDLACKAARGSFAGLAKGAWRSPSYATDRSLYFSTERNGFTFLRSTDGGRTIKPFTSLNAALAPITAAMKKHDVTQTWPASMAFGPKGRIYVRVVVVGFSPDAGSPPSQVILRSDDNGARWKTVGTQYHPDDRRRGTLPFQVTPNTLAENSTFMQAAPDGRLFAMGDGFGESDIGPWCSVDGGVRWYRTCPR
ncbi:MAG TPA: hypothetical protein VNA20_03470 [Frankiaceae bacterium]|nr:hypothetical protein [Frankiaceae bacterium]